MNKRELREVLMALLEDATYEEGSVLEDAQVYSYEEAGLLTRDEGLVLKLANGNEFQITIVQSK